MRVPPCPVPGQGQAAVPGSGWTTSQPWLQDYLYIRNSFTQVNNMHSCGLQDAEYRLQDATSRHLKRQRHYCSNSNVVGHEWVRFQILNSMSIAKSPKFCCNIQLSGAQQGQRQSFAPYRCRVQRRQPHAPFHALRAAQRRHGQAP